MEKRREITINEDVKCKQCGKGGAVKTDQMDEYGICLSCATKNIKNTGRVIGMQKTKEQVKTEVEVLIENYWLDIVNAYEKGAGMSFSIKVTIEPGGGKVGVTPTIEFYPLPKTKSEKFTAWIDENQLKLAGM